MYISEINVQLLYYFLDIHTCKTEIFPLLNKFDDVLHSMFQNPAALETWCLLVGRMNWPLNLVWAHDSSTPLQSYTLFIIHNFYTTASWEFLRMPLFSDIIELKYWVKKVSIKCKTFLFGHTQSNHIQCLTLKKSIMSVRVCVCLLCIHVCLHICISMYVLQEILLILLYPYLSLLPFNLPVLT